MSRSAPSRRRCSVCAGLQGRERLAKQRDAQPVHYNDLTRRYFDRAVNAGVGLDSAGFALAPVLFRGAAGSRAQGTWVQFGVQVSGRGGGSGMVRVASFLAFGCPHVIAVAAWLAERAEGLEVRPVLPEDIGSLRQRFAIPIEKTGRLLIVEDAWIATLRAASGAALPHGHEAM
jgi:hypothetical protein